MFSILPPEISHQNHKVLLYWMYSVYVVSAVLFLDIRSAYYAICRDAMTQKSETLEEFSESVACVTVLNCGFVYNLRVRVVCATALELHIHS